MAKFSKAEVVDKIRRAPVVPLFTHTDIAVAQGVVKACYIGGIRAFEYTNRAQNAAEVFKKLVVYVRHNFPDMAMGIGTIYNAEEAEYFASLDADFIIQPIVDTGVADVCKKYNLSWMPGAMTLTEIYTAKQAGADIVKIFPANIGGPEFISAIKGPMPDIKLMATGGVEPTEQSISAWRTAGAFCVGMGSQLFNGDNLKSDGYEGITNGIKESLQVFKN